VRGLKYKTKISLTTMANNQQLQMSAQAAALVEKFYMLTPEVQQKVAGFYRQQLRVLDPKCDADTAIQPNQPTPPAPEPTKTQVAVAFKGENLNPEERATIMQKVGVQETPDQASSAPPIKTASDGKKNGTNGSKAKLGDAGAAGGTKFSTQLTQAGNKK
jgi:hypothetical protein